jgi:cold shock CspA family protein
VAVALIQSAPQERVTGRIVTLAGTYAFVSVNDEREHVFLHAGEMPRDEFDALILGQTVSGRLICEPGRKGKRLIEARAE